DPPASNDAVHADKGEMHVRLRVKLGSLLVPLLFAVGASAQPFVPTGRDTLRGLPGVEVAVEDVAPELPQPEVATMTLRTAVEQRLRAGGITVYATQKEN